MQLSGHPDSLGLKDGWRVVSDVREGRTGDERLWRRERKHDHRRMTVHGA